MNILSTVGLVVIQNNWLLLVRKRNTFNFMLPGGKIDVGEEEVDCLPLVAHFLTAPNPPLN